MVAVRTVHLGGRAAFIVSYNISTSATQSKTKHLIDLSSESKNAHVGIHYSWIACQLEVGTPIMTFAVEVQFQIQDQFWIPQPKLHICMYLISL